MNECIKCGELFTWRQMATLILQPKLVDTARGDSPSPEKSFEKLVER